MIMPTKDKKSQVRIHPELATALSVIARADNKPGYELLEEVVLEWILNNKPHIRSHIEHAVIDVAKRRKIVFKD